MPHRIICLLLCVAGALAGRAALPPDDFHADARQAATALQRWYNARGLWDTTGWWNGANCLDAIEDIVIATNGRERLEVLATTFNHNKSRRFLNEYYDDEGWWALAWIRAFDLTGQRRYLDMAKTIFADMTGGWTQTCAGGSLWRKDRSYKNAIPNELFLVTAIRLHQRTPGDGGPGSYLDWALREWGWFRGSGMINESNLVNDGLTRRCENNGRTTWTYNQGVILGGLTELYKTTGDTNYLNQAMAIADAATATLVATNGVLREPCEPNGCGGADVPQFKGIFARYLAGLYDVCRKPAYYQLLSRSAHSVWLNSRDAENHLGLRWTGPFDAADAARHSSALAVVAALAEPRTAILSFATGAGNPAFNHEVGADSGSLAWTCDLTNTARPGLMLAGPCLDSLAPGAHRAYFRLAVSATGQSDAPLARLEARAANRGITLAARDVSWNSFPEAGQATEFALGFTNPAAGGPIEFRLYWNHASNAPALTVTDVILDSPRSWTAANLEHEIGRLDGHNNWAADPVRDPASGYLVRGPGTLELPPGKCSAVFELAVDNFNRDRARVATISVTDVNTGRVVASRDLARSDFSNILFHPFVLPFVVEKNHRYDFRTWWHFTPAAPRLTQRSVLVKTRSLL